MSIMAPEKSTTDEAAELESLLEETPGCEVHPAMGSDETCGDPSVAYLLLEIRHKARCTRGQGTCTARLWVCAHHRDAAHAGQLRCSICNGRVKVLQVI